MKYYISQNDVEASIDYFRNAGFDSDDMLFLFLMSKHLGISTSYSVTYLVKKLNNVEKKEYLHTIWMLGGLFDSTEECGKRGLLFPPAFSKLAFYQPGTDFNSVLGRIKDTIEKKNINVPIYNDNSSMLTLKSNYRDLIKDNYLNGNKISLSKLAAWIFRYTSFEFNNTPNDRQFTRVVESAIRKFFKITKNDFSWLFENDLTIDKLLPADSGISGNTLRGSFAFDDAKRPEIQQQENEFERQSSSVEKDIVERYLALNGDNPSDMDIFSILKSKKQIILTGVPGVGKSRYTQILCKNNFFTHKKTIQFHASYGYEDFIGSEILKTDIDGTSVTTR